MALIAQREGRKTGGGYSRLFDNDPLGFLMSRVHGASISAGSELERLIKSMVRRIEDLDGFLETGAMEEGVAFADKRQVKRSKTVNVGSAEPDFLIFKRRDGLEMCHVVELKDGDAFDTKKSTAEAEAMKSFVQNASPDIPFRVRMHFCCFNQDSRDEIVNGFKGRITHDEALTGQEFCDLLEISFDEVVAQRQSDCQANLVYFVDQLVEIPEIRDLLSARMSKLR